MPVRRSGTRRGAITVVAVLGPVALSGILVAFRGALFSSNAAVVLVLAVLAAAIIGGRRWSAAFRVGQICRFQLSGRLSLAEYDAHTAAAGLDPVARWSTWDRAPFSDTSDYVVALDSKR